MENRAFPSFGNAKMMSPGRCRSACAIGLWHFAALVLELSVAPTLLVLADEVIE